MKTDVKLKYNNINNIIILHLFLLIIDFNDNSLVILVCDGYEISFNANFVASISFVFCLKIRN